MKKKLLAVITALALCLTLTPTVAFASGTATGGNDYLENPNQGGTDAPELEEPENPEDPVITKLTVIRDSETTATITFNSSKAGSVAIVFKRSDGLYNYYIHDMNGVVIGRNTVKIEEEDNSITGTDAYEIAVYFVENEDGILPIMYSQNPLNEPGAVKGTVPAVHTCTSATWLHDATNHWKVCDTCGKKINDAAHSGGEANCTDKAVCDICKQAYGEVKESNHKNLVKTEAKPATYTEAGNIEYWHCEDCDKYFSDAAGTTEITQESTIIPKLESKPGGGTVTPSVTKSRVAGDDRFETAIKVADKLKSELGVVKFNNIVVANSDEFADALSATALAADKDAPILVVNKNNESTVKTYIANNLNKGGNVYIIGGTAVVSESFEKSLTNCKVTRLGGSDRYETNLEVLKELKVTGASDIMVASGLKYPDALSASATGNPVLLVGKTLTDNQKAYLATLGGNDDYYVIGGTAAVNADVAKAVDDYGTVIRLGGDTRYETGLAVAEEFFTNARTVVIASGDDFPDGLTGGVLANAMKAPLMLVNQYNTTVAADFVDDNSVRTVIAIGGTTVIPDATLNKVA